MASIKHTHTYVLYKERSRNMPLKQKWFRCADPDCTHTARFEMVSGKRSKCNLCGAEFILSNTDLLRVEPRCMACSNTKKAKTLKVTATIAADLVSSLFMTDELKDVDESEADDDESYL